MRSLAFRVRRNFGETLQNLTDFWQISLLAKQEILHTTINVILLISCFSSNIILIEEKMIYKFICKWWPPCVWTSLLWNVGWERILRRTRNIIKAGFITCSRKGPLKMSHLSIVDQIWRIRAKGLKKCIKFNSAYGSIAF